MNRVILIDEREAWELLSDRELQGEWRIERRAHHITDESAPACTDYDACQECEQPESQLCVRRIQS